MSGFDQPTCDPRDEESLPAWDGDEEPDVCVCGHGYVVDLGLCAECLADCDREEAGSLDGTAWWDAVGKDQWRSEQGGS